MTTYGSRGKTARMATRLTPQARSKLIEVGDALDIDQQLAVGTGGEVFVNPLEERADDAERKCKGPTGRQGQQRWAGQGSGSRQETGQSEAARFGSRSLSDHYLAGEAASVELYDAKFHRTAAGIWVVAPSNPLGADGPTFNLAVFLPENPEIRPRSFGWAFSKLGPFPKFVGPRHTNFPHHDICAQGADDDAWVPSDGVRPLLNLYSSWLFRHCYLLEVGRWPGRQWGASALYRRTEFHPDEWCGCGESKRYRDCHLKSDTSLSDEDAAAEHVKIMGSEYGPRNPPKAVKAFARSAWKKPPLHPLV